MVISLAPAPAGQGLTKNTSTGKPSGAHLALPFLDAKHKKDIPVLTVQAAPGGGGSYIASGLARNFGFKFVDIRSSLKELIADFRAGKLPKSETPQLKDVDGKLREFDPSKVEERMKQAKLVDDEIVICALRHRLKKIKKLKDSGEIDLKGLVFEGVATPKRIRALRRMGLEIGNLFGNISRRITILVPPKAAKTVMDTIKNCIKCTGFSIPGLEAFKPSEDGKCDRINKEGKKCGGDLIRGEHEKNLSKPARFRQRLEGFLRNSKSVKKEFYNAVNVGGRALGAVTEAVFAIGGGNKKIDMSKLTEKDLTLSDKDHKKYIKQMNAPDEVLERITQELTTENELSLERLSPQQIAENQKKEAKLLTAK